MEKNPPINAGVTKDMDVIPGSERSPGGRAWQLTPVFMLGEPPWTEEPAGLESMGLQRVRRD